MEFLRMIDLSVAKHLRNINTLSFKDRLKYLFSEARTEFEDFISTFKVEPKSFDEAKDRKIACKAYFESCNFSASMLICFSALEICPQDTDKARNLYFSLIEMRARIFFKIGELRFAWRDIEFLKTTKYGSKSLNQSEAVVKAVLTHINISETNEPTEELAWKSTNKMYPALTSKVKVDRNDTEGRFVIATENIEMGEIIGVENPYSWATDDSKQCNHCLLKLPALFVCPACPAPYCSAECFEQAKPYHQYECGFKMSSSSLVVLRMITGRSLRKVIDDEWAVKEQRKDGIYKSDDYYNVNGLWQHYGLVHPEEDSSAFKALFLLIILRKKNYFTSQGCKAKADKLSKKEIFVGRLLLRYINIVKHNSLGIHGIALYTTFSLINHGCDRSAIWYGVGKRGVLRSIQPIKAGQRITINYIGSKTYLTATKRERNDVLFKRYKFICDCRACVEDWSESWDSETYRIKCKCGAFIVLTGDSGASNHRCSNCKKIVRIDAAMKKLEEIRFTIGYAMQLFNSLGCEAGRKLVIKTIEIAFKYFELPNTEIRILQEMFDSLY